MNKFRHNLNDFKQNFGKLNNQIIRLNDRLLVDLQPVADWCNKNLTSYVFYVDYKDFYKLMTSSFTIKSFPIFVMGPTFMFEEESDMMAFKLRWLDYLADGDIHRLSSDLFELD